MWREFVAHYGGALSCAVPVVLDCDVLLCYCVRNSCVMVRSVLCCVVCELMSFFVMCFLASGGLRCVVWCCVTMLGCLCPAV